MSWLEFEISYAGLDDVELLVAHRLSMWRDIHPELVEKVEQSEEATRQWIREKMSQDRLIAIVARAQNGRVAGSGCIWIRDEQPRPTSQSQAVPYLMSMYTEKEFRRKGVAKMIVQSAMKWCREHHYDGIILHASGMARSLYSVLGFEPTGEMRLKL